MLPAGTKLGSCEIVALVGAGGMGEVYRARDRTLGRDVAIKVLPASVALDPERVARFEREARVLASLNHPHIAAIYGLEHAEGIRALVLELVQGETLANRLRVGPLSVSDTIAVARQIADALDAAHEKGIIHRDLKPANVIVTRDGTVKVLDFGVAKALAPEVVEGDPAQSPTVTAVGTRAGVILGTPAYMSPEQARAQPIDKRADIWAFGCVLYEMLTGRRAFAGETISDTIVAILEREPDWTALPDRTPASLRRLLQRCLDKNPRRRLRDMGDAGAELDALLVPGAEPTAAPTAGGSAKRWRAVAAALGGALVLTIGAMTLRQRDGPVSGPGWSTAQAVARQLTDYGGVETASALAPDGRSFAFVSSHAGSADIWVRQVSGGDPVRITADAAPETDLVYGPDGETIYFTHRDAAGSAIWRVPALGGQPRTVVSNARMAAPSPDGRSLAYLAVGPPIQLVVAALDGSGTRTLASDILPGVGGERPAWSPDGRYVSYPKWELFGPLNLFLANVASGESRQVTRFTGSAEGIQWHAWLPDSRHLVVAHNPSSPGPGQDPQDLSVLDTSDGSLTRVTIGLRNIFGALSTSVDGSRLLVTATERRNEVWRVPLGRDPEESGRAAGRIVDSTYGPFWTFVSRDGARLLFSGRGGNLWLGPTDGRTAPQLITAFSDRSVMHSSLSPDASHAVFASSTSGPADIWIQNVDGSGLRQLTRDNAADAWPVWSPDGDWIVFNSVRAGAQETWRVRPDGRSPEKIVNGFFRGDWIRQPTGTGTWLVTSLSGGNGIRLLDFERRTVVWERQVPGTTLSLPVFSPDGRWISLPVQESLGRDAIWVFDAATGQHRVAVRFDEPFDINFRASWVDDGKAFVVHRVVEASHVVLFDRFWIKGR